jgi:hypothetical protein
MGVPPHILYYLFDPIISSELSPYPGGSLVVERYKMKERGERRNPISFGN